LTQRQTDIISVLHYNYVVLCGKGGLVRCCFVDRFDPNYVVQIHVLFVYVSNLVRVYFNVFCMWHEWPTRKVKAG